MAWVQADLASRTRKKTDWNAELARFNKGAGVEADAATRASVFSLLPAAADPTRARTIKCDGDLCMLSASAADLRAFSRTLLAGGSEWSRVHVRDAFVHADGRVLLQLDRAGHADGVAALEKRLAAVERDSARCRVDSPGTLDVQLQLTAHFDPEDPPAAIATRIGGALAATSARACVEQLVATSLAAQPLPERISDGTASRTLKLGR